MFALNTAKTKVAATILAGYIHGSNEGVNHTIHQRKDSLDLGNRLNRHPEKVMALCKCLMMIISISEHSSAPLPLRLAVFTPSILLLIASPAPYVQGRMMSCTINHGTCRRSIDYAVNKIHGALLF